LVIDEAHGLQVPTHYAVSTRDNLAQAITDLQEREGTPNPDNIGFCQVAGPHFAARAIRRPPTACEVIRAWGVEKQFDAVIWTALPPRFRDAIGVPFTPAAALHYLDGLPGPTKELALQYIRTAPPQTTTAFRRLFNAANPEN
jgi:sirohydrochlorin ferrochelatase